MIISFLLTFFVIFAVILFAMTSAVFSSFILDANINDIVKIILLILWLSFSISANTVFVMKTFDYVFKSEKQLDNKEK
jgi:uncharacterized protein YqhQ